MPFVIPSFPLSCNIYTNGGGPPAAPRLVSVCQLRWGPSRTSQNYVGLLLPAGTDIRGLYHSTSSDVVECPAGSGRLYRCVWMDDVAPGFTNVHREAVLEWIRPFITPTP